MHKLYVHSILIQWLIHYIFLKPIFNRTFLDISFDKMIDKEKKSERDQKKRLEKNYMM